METGFIERHKYYSLSFDNFVGWCNYGKIDENDSSRLKLLNIDSNKVVHKKSKKGQTPAEMIDILEGDLKKRGYKILGTTRSSEFRRVGNLKIDLTTKVIRQDSVLTYINSVMDKNTN